MKVLFLCTGNYYRSRLAEELLRGYSAVIRLDLVCDSAGLGPIPNPINIGPMRLEAVEYLLVRGMNPDSVARFPRKCHESDILLSDIVIGMNEPEHRRMVEGQFLGRVHERVRYWRVPDMDEDPDGMGPGLMEQNVKELLREILARLADCG